LDPKDVLSKTQNEDEKLVTDTLCIRPKFPLKEKWTILSVREVRVSSEVYSIKRPNQAHTKLFKIKQGTSARALNLVFFG